MNPINRWIHFDNLMNLCSVAVLVWVALDSYTLDEARASLLFVCANHWLIHFFRMCEAGLSSRGFKSEEALRLRSAVRMPAAGQLYQDIEKSEAWIVALGSVMIVSFTVLLSLNFDLGHTTKLSLLAIPLLALPFYQSIASKVLRRSIFHRVYIPRFQHFNEIARIRHIRTHHLGVLAESELQLEDWWLDPSSVWSEEEVEELVASMARDVAHPVCEALHRKFEGFDRKLRISDLTSLPHLGLQVSFRNAEGQLLQVCLGSLNWFQSELHDISPEGLRVNQNWNDQQRRTCFLSINKRIVAGFSFSQLLRSGQSDFFDIIRKQGRSLCLLSSSNSACIQVEEKEFLELAKSKLPVEREVQLQHWRERAPRFIELRSTWDHPPSDEAYPIIFGRRTDRVPFDQSVCILGDSLLSCQWLLDEAEHWTKQHRLSFILPPMFAVGGAVILLTPLYLLFPVISGACFSIWQLRQVKI
jgi:hypothetical protein